MEENQHTASYKEVSTELGKKLIKLYGAKIFPRQGKVFADMLFQTGIEAGTYIASLADIEERKIKVDLASRAMVKLNQTAYLISVRKEAGYYTASQVAEMEEYAQILIDAMRELLNTAFAQMRSDAARPKAATPAPQPAVAPAPRPRTVINVDPDGFNAPADE